MINDGERMSMTEPNSCAFVFLKRSQMSILICPWRLISPNGGVRGPWLVNPQNLSIMSIDHEGPDALWLWVPRNPPVRGPSDLGNAIVITHRPHKQRMGWTKLTGWLAAALSLTVRWVGGLIRWCQSWLHLRRRAILLYISTTWSSFWSPCCFQTLDQFFSGLAYPGVSCWAATLRAKRFPCWLISWAQSASRQR